MEVYYGQTPAMVGVSRTTPDPTSISVDIGYQGCADTGVCYPTNEVNIAVSWPGAADARKHA